MDDNHTYDSAADRVGFFVKIMITGCNRAAVMSDTTPYYDGAEKKVELSLYNFMVMFKKVEHASTHFMTDSACNAYEHITRQHVRDIMTAYEPYLKDPPNFTLTFGDEFNRILRNIASTMELWK